MATAPKFKLTLDSNNHKTGPMPVSTSMMQTCPTTCPLRGRGCYGNYGPMLSWWRACSLDQTATSEAYCNFIERVRNEIPAGACWRHNQAGDLLSKDNEHIDRPSVMMLCEANSGKFGFTFTHYGVVEQHGTSKEAANFNRGVIEEMNRSGFVVNVSCNSLAHADRVAGSGIAAPITVMVPEQVMKDKVRTLETPAGRKVIVCPNVTMGKTCKDCGLCMDSARKAIVAFPCHGSGKKRAEEVIVEWSTGDFVHVEHKRKGTYKIRHTYHAGVDGNEQPKTKVKPKTPSKSQKRIAELEKALGEALDHISERDYDHYCQIAVGNKSQEELEESTIVGGLRNVLEAK